MIFCKDDEIKIYTDVFPKTLVRAGLPVLSDEQMKAIKEKPYLNENNVNFFIEYEGEEYRIFFPKGYTWDGASIPFGFRWIIGYKGDPKFLIPSMVHDKLCENHYLVANNRYLSSLIFKKLLKACGVGKVRAQIMFLAVDNFQKLQGWG
jgi:hypothetical protein